MLPRQCALTKQKLIQKEVEMVNSMKALSINLIYILILQPTDAAKVVSHPITGEIQVWKFLKDHYYTKFYDSSPPPPTGLLKL